MFDVLLRGCCSYQKNRFGWVSRNLISVKRMRNFLTFLFLFFTFLGSATNYYVSNSGNDSKDGKTPETAWQTINKVNKSTFAPGDQILFKRGDVWDKDLVIPSSGTAGKPIVVSAYGEGDNPMFYGLKYVRNWEPKGGNLYATYSEGLHYRNPILVGGEQKVKEKYLTDLDENHEWWQTDWDSIYVYLDNPADTSNIRQMVQGYGVLVYGKSYVEVENFKFVGVGSAMTARNSSNVIFRNCTADSSFYPTITVFDNSANVLFDGLTITNSFSNGAFFSNGADNIEVKNCTILNSGIATDRYGDHQSIGMWNTKGDISIHDCYIEQYHGKWCMEFTAEIKDQWKSYNGEVRFYNNVIKYNGGDYTSDARFMSVWCGDYYIYNNLFIGDKNKPICGVYTGEVENIRTHTYIYNNTFVGLEIGVISYQNNYYDPTTSGEGAVVVKNNIFSEISDSYIRVTGGNDIYGGMKAFTEVNNNLYHGDNNVINRWSTECTIEDWLIDSGQDANSFYENPLFKNAAGGDYTLQSGSPAINAGTDVGLSHDINGNPIVGAPDIGAYESNVTTNDTEKPTITGFTIPGTFDSLIVPVSTFTATDNISVTGFKITETATAPNADDAGWSDSAPTSYTFSSEGTKTLYAWAKDAVGNVSASVNDQVIITLPTTTTTTNHYGYTEIYNSITTDPYRRAMPVTFSESGEISSISVYHEGGTGDVLLGVYSDQSGVPSSLLGLTVSTVINSTAGWQTVPLVNPVEVTSGQTVWLTWVFENNPGVRFTTGTPGRAHSSDTWSAEMPATFGTSSFADVKYSIYCSLTDIYKPEIYGYTEIYSNITTDPYRRAMPVTFSESGEISSISIYHEGGTGDVLLGVYSDQSGVPSSLLGLTVSTVINSTAGWQTVPLVNPVEVTSGQTVWLTWVFENNPGVRFTTGTPGRAHSSDTWSAEMPATFGTSSFADVKYSIYCSLTDIYKPEIYGYTEIYSNITTDPYRRAMPVTFSESGEISSISIYHEGGTGDVLLGVYSDQSGVPSSLLGLTVSTVINSTAGWQTVPLVNPVEVTSGQTVWLTWVFENNPGVRFTTGTPGRAHSSETWSAGMPATFGTSSFADVKYSIYCTYVLKIANLKEATIPEIEITEPTPTLSVGYENKEANSLTNVNSGNLFERNDFKIYPNPANSFVNIDYSLIPETETRIFILDATGRIIISRSVNSSSNRIDISQLSPGTYFIKLVNPQWNSSKKLIVVQ